MSRKGTVYYAMYSRDGFGVYSSKNRMDEAIVYTESETKEQFDDMEDAHRFAQEGFDSLNVGMSSNDLLNDEDARLNWFYRVPRKAKPKIGIRVR